MKPPDPLSQLQRDAWIGDAVLELYARAWVLRQHGQVDAALKSRLTCNEFLNCFANPTRVEADIGAVYQREGLDAAFTYIHERLQPLFDQREAKRQRMRR